MFFKDKKNELPGLDEVLPGRREIMSVAKIHFVNEHTLKGPFAENLDQAVFALGCFWGAEKTFWQIPDVYTTAVGYAGGLTPNPNYQEVCSGFTGHAEVVLVVFDPEKISYGTLLAFFWEGHDPTQGMQQGRDIGTQYRSAIFTYSNKQSSLAQQSKTAYQSELTRVGYDKITTEILPLEKFFYAENYHQQYLAKNPNGYCGIGSTGVSYPFEISTVQ
jgi:peptide-methionine (S)-S-oxide reductase